MKLKVSTDISSQLVTQAVAINYLKYTGNNTTELALINSMCKAARQLIEKKFDVALGAQTLICDIEPDDLYNNRFVLPRGPHKPYSSSEFLVYTVDSEGTETALTKNTGYYLYGDAGDHYTIEFATTTATVSLATDYAYYRVQYVAGYGNTGCETMPEIFNQAILKLVASWFQNRDTYVPVMTNEVTKMLLPYSRYAGF